MVTVTSNAEACSRLIPGIVTSNRAEGMDVVFVVFCVGSGLYDGLVTRSDECDRVYVCVI